MKLWTSNHTFRQLQRKVVFQASTLPEPAVDVALRDLGWLLDQDAGIQELQAYSGSSFSAVQGIELLCDL